MGMANVLHILGQMCEKGVRQVRRDLVGVCDSELLHTVMRSPSGSGIDVRVCVCMHMVSQT